MLDVVLAACVNNHLSGCFGCTQASAGQFSDGGPILAAVMSFLTAMPFIV